MKSGWILLLLFLAVLWAWSGPVWERQPDTVFLDELAWIQQARTEGESLPPRLSLMAALGGESWTQAWRVSQWWPVLENALLLSAVFLGTLVLAWWLRRKGKPAVARWLPLLVGGVFVVLTIFFYATGAIGRRVPPLSPELSVIAWLPRAEATAQSTAENNGRERIWRSPAAVRWLNALAPSAAPRQPDAGAGDPSTWRALDREDPFGAVLLAGPLAEYRPLLDHLVISPDWELREVTPWTMVWSRRPADAGSSTTAWPRPNATDLLPLFPHPEDRAYYWARMGEQMAALQDFGAARRFFREALALEPTRPDARTMAASFLASRGQWPEAVAEAEAVLELHPRYAPAYQVLVQAELGALRPARAWEAARRLRDLQPEDPFSLFLHARAANTVGAFWDEADSLRRLIRISQRLGLPTAHYQIYLGQALARQGLVDHAAEAWKLALSAGELNAEQQAQVREFLGLEDPPETTTPP
jgi:hypothetical protein